jgi:general stress protein 26
MELNFDELRNEYIEFIEKNGVLVLATSADDHVTARSMSFVIYEGKLYCQTDSSFRKTDQILRNRKVSVCRDNFQIEGTAEITGHPTLPGNIRFITEFERVHNSSFRKYSLRDSEVVIAITPQKAVIWKYIDKKPCRDFIDFEERKAWREYYE